MLFLQALPKLSLASQGQQHPCRPLSMESKPRLMGPFEARVFFCIPPRQPQPHPSQSQFVLSVPPTPLCLCFSSSFSQDCPAPSTPGRLSSKAACLLLAHSHPSRTPHSSLVCGPDSPAASCQLSLASDHSWWCTRQAPSLGCWFPRTRPIAPIRLELCFAHSRGSVNIYQVNPSALQQGPS